MFHRRTFFLTLMGLLALLWAASFLVIHPATAAPTRQEATPTPPSPLSIANQVCLDCHGRPGLVLKLDNGEELNLTVLPEDYAHSIHGEEGYACVQCHTTVGNYPHPAFAAKDNRDASLQLYQVCYRCHSGEYERVQDSVHATAMAAGKREAAVCTDCHGSHTVQQLINPSTHQLLPEARIWIPQTCAKCHNAIYQKYRDSVHGKALTDGITDVPTCIDCHGVHNIQNPTTAGFRNNSPQICAKCHTDPKRMSKYGISTDVLSTYVADFHGTTVVMFEKESPDAPTNKPVCFDCHGIHDISMVNDPQNGLQIRQNLLARCQKCHPDATANFPDAWLSHYIPTPEKTPLVYYVNLFYKFFIPGTLGGMGFLVLLDVSWRIRTRNGKRPLKTDHPLPPTPAPSGVPAQAEKASSAAAAQAEVPASETPPPPEQAEPPALILPEIPLETDPHETEVSPIPPTDEEAAHE